MPPGSFQCFLLLNLSQTANTWFFSLIISPPAPEKCKLLNTMHRRNQTLLTVLVPHYWCRVETVNDNGKRFDNEHVRSNTLLLGTAFILPLILQIITHCVNWLIQMTCEIFTRKYFQKLIRTNVACGKAWKGVWFLVRKPLSQDNVSWICMMEHKAMLK